MTTTRLIAAAIDNLTAAVNSINAEIICFEDAIENGGEGGMTAKDIADAKATAERLVREFNAVVDARRALMMGA
jgi:hypothetical protein